MSVRSAECSLVLPFIADILINEAFTDWFF